MNLRTRALVIPFLTLAGAASGGVVTFSLDTIYTSPPGAPANPGPWVTATFEDTGPNTVRLTIARGNLADGEFIGDFLFNTSFPDGALGLTIVHVSGPVPRSIELGNDNLHALGSNHEFDVEIDFESGNAPGSQRFDQEFSHAVFDIISLNPLLAADFHARMGNQFAGFFAATHLQGLPGGASAGITADPICDGDINCDGAWDQKDVMCIIFAIAGDDGCYCAGTTDVNGDGASDQGDIADIIQIIAGAPCP